MGCNISNRVGVAQLSSEELQKNQEAKNQTKNDSIAGTEAVPSQDRAAWPTGTSKNGAKLEDETSEGDSPKELPERFTSSQKSNNAQSTDALLTSEFTSKSRPLQETERQKSSDILEELRMQGAIKSKSTTARTGEAYENKRDALEKTLKKPPARLEKIQFGNKEVGDFTVKDMKTSAEAKKQVREQELNKMPQHITFFPATPHQTTGKQTEKECPSFESQGGTDTPQPSPLDGEPGALLKEITAQTIIPRTRSSSLITYNSINEVIWI
ncbi:PREDICTED: LOW QUALITY PROTEIN: stathmin domain-containing protein 1 [Nipponia nippon]|uniref:LOW QUALITY PROTEIN: stathmin domain-containing protein 1 n=1 Tax=Nipponia nippon TaxID=128390 RepID=UPI0005111E75|nr:PREDICTED: LOW QUALITY PROTEIN: stathmin domain-containing protein 1 [Nipponia nippon]